MRLLRKIRLRIRSLFLRASMDDELEAELSDYLEPEQRPPWSGVPQSLARPDRMCSARQTNSA
jgi:hypothetical protein